MNISVKYVSKFINNLEFYYKWIFLWINFVNKIDNKVLILVLTISC